ncbi:MULTISPECIES: PepSY domain-containing protein [Gracilibacillus]|uniref:PepSY domain-containing protein n=1 Tax=Gracilibacillus TaxID=74385 RepID=UPI0008263B0D|nr:MULTISPECIES: PepSY domain-containing protein [Gracilibacillus]
MKKQQTIILFMLGCLIGFLIGQTRQKNKPLKPETVLRTVKKNISEHTEVSGSWIYMRIEPFRQHDINYHVYHGGITKHVHGEHIPYEFYVDAYSGTVLSMTPQH